MIQRVQNKKQLKEFILFSKTLYKENEYYVPPLFFFLKRELKREVLKKKDYTALISCGEKGEINGRLLYTFSHNEKEGKDICYFSYFDCINDKKVSEALLSEMQSDAEKHKIGYMEGTFCPYDPDNRRGILFKGFDEAPTIFTSYNYSYYNDLLENSGFGKVYDTFSMSVPYEKWNSKLLLRIEKSVPVGLKIENVNLWKLSLKRDLHDIYTIIKQATTDLNYQSAPSEATIRAIAKGLKWFINGDLIKIVREEGTERPVGFVAVLPDLNQIIKKTGGRVRVFRFIRDKFKVTSARGMLQYIIPEYQSSALLATIFAEIKKSFEKYGITHFEGGTIMEDNPASWRLFERLGGEIAKIYRIYGKDIGAATGETTNEKDEML